MQATHNKALQKEQDMLPACCLGKRTDEAQRWLTGIFEYIAADNPQAAARTVQGICDRAQELKRFPVIGSRYTISSRNVPALLCAT